MATARRPTFYEGAPAPRATRSVKVRAARARAARGERSATVGAGARRRHSGEHRRRSGAGSASHDGDGERYAARRGSLHGDHSTGRTSRQSYGRVTGRRPTFAMSSRRAAISPREGTIPESYWTSIASSLSEALAKSVSRNTRAALTSQNGREYDCTRRATGPSGGVGAQLSQTRQPRYAPGWNAIPQVSMEDEAK